MFYFTTLMKLVIRILLNLSLCLILSLSVCNAVGSAGEGLAKRVEGLLSSEHVEDEIIVRFKDEVALDNSRLDRASSKAHSKTGAVVKRNFRKLKGMQLVKLPRGMSINDALKVYLENPQVKYAEPNYIVKAALTPNDPDLGKLWGLHNTGQTGGTSDADIDAPEAWDITTGSGNVVIAVIDSGVAINSNISTGHPELIGNIWTNPGETSCTDGIDNDSNGYIDDCYGWDFIDNDNDPMDYAGHGSHVAGTIAAAGNNNQGITGIMWNADIMPLRFLDGAGSGSTADAISAIIYASENGAHVINNSWGGSGFSQALEDAINASDALVVCAAGNEGSNNDTAPFYPASYSSANLISVAAVDHNDSLASFSNYGASSVDLAAPGADIYSTLPARNVLLFDQMTGLSNWTAASPWGLSTSVYSSSPSSASDSPSGNYSNNVNASLKLAYPLVLTNLRGTVMDYIMRLETESNHDYLCIDASLNGIAWSNITCWHGSTGGWFYSLNEDLTQYDNTRKFYIRFRLFSNSSINYDGAYIDDVAITTYSGIYDGTEYASYNGTSMAAPHVSGVAGLVKSANPALTNFEIKDIILNNVDIKSSLSGKVVSGGRLNAYNAVYSASCAASPVKIVSTGAGYSSLQSAYDAAGSGDVILSQDALFTGDLFMDLNKSVAFEGGYECSYTARTGITSLNGNMTVSNGTVTIGGLSLE